MAYWWSYVWKKNKHIKRIYILLASLSVSSFGFAQNWNAECEKLLTDKNASEQTQLACFQKWKASKPKEAEMFIAWANFYFNKAQTNVLNLVQDPNATAEVKTIDDTIPTVSLNIENQINDSLALIAAGYLDAALALHPKRLDIHFGKAHILKSIRHYEAQAKALMNVLNLYNTDKKDWLWANGDKKEDMPVFLQDNIHSYISELFNAEQDDYVILLSQEMIRLFPKDVRFYSNAGSSLAIMKKYKASLEYFEKAYAVDKKDKVVLHNLAKVNEMAGDKKKAIFYYSEILKYGNEEDKQDAKMKIEELGKKD